MKRKVGGGRKQLPPPSQPGISPNSFDLHFIQKVQQELLSFLSSPLSWKKMDKTALPSFILANHLPASFAGEHLLLGCRILCKDDSHSHNLVLVPI